MSVWGVKLYQNETAEDVKLMYKEKLREGKTNEEATQELINEFGYATEDIDDAPNFWFALADQQWKLGRLLTFVKEQALMWIENGADLQMWYSESEKLGNERKKVIEKLREELDMPQPPEKKIHKKQQYICPWKDGDVLALPLNEVDTEYDLNYKYIMFQQFTQMEFCGNIIPAIRCWLSDSTNYTTERNGCTECIRWRNNLKSGLNLYTHLLDITSKRVLPKDLIYIGNYDVYVPNDDGGFDPYHNSLLFWRNFQENVINEYIKFNIN